MFCALVLGLQLSSCNRDKCRRVVCINGACVDGTCNCTAGYYGPECNSIVNEGLEGTWELTEECTAGSDHYEVTIEVPSYNKVTIKLMGVWEQQDALEAGFAANGSDFSISRTPVGNVEIDAYGVLDDTRTEITLNYNVYHPGAGSPYDVCVATLTQQ